MLGMMNRPQTYEERRQRARASLRRALWYLIVLIVLLILMMRPQLIRQFWPLRIPTPIPPTQDVR